MIHPPIYFWCLFTPIFRACSRSEDVLGFLRSPMVSPPFWRDGGSQPTNLRLSVQETGLRSLIRRANRRDRSDVLLLFQALWQFCHQLRPPM
jgi:hypothetical protein